MRQRVDLTRKIETKMRQKIDLTKKIESGTKTIIKRTTTRFYQNPIFAQETTTEEENNELEDESEESIENTDDNNDSENNNNNTNDAVNENHETNNENQTNNNPSTMNNAPNTNNFIDGIKKALNNTKNKSAKKAATEGAKKKAAAAILKNSVTIKIILIVLAVALLAFGIIFLIVLITGYQQSNYAAIMAECSSITVVDTDCDANGNCTNKYSGKVSFEDYIAGVIAAEDNINSDSLEYYKTVAIVTRTELLNLIDDSCEVEGNSSFKDYIPIEESTNQDIIQKAVEETSRKIITKDEMLMSSPSTTACLVNQDDTNYYIRFGSEILEETKIQKVPKEWVLTTTYNELLEDFSTQISLTEDEFSRDCPEGTNDYGISLVGAYYLIDGVNYKSDEVIKYYYGDDIEVKDASIIIGENINGFINPLSTLNCTSAFGGRIHPTTGKQSYHSGIDFGAAGGTPIYATKSGVISRIVRDVTIINAKTSSSNNGYGYGNNIIIDHQDGTSTLYAHMKYGSIPSSLSVGDEVTQGEEIGQVGTTGVSTGNHLHYEVRINNSAVNPADYMDLSAATGTCRR